MNKRYKKNKMGSDSDHSRSMLRNLGVSLISYELIETSKPRSRELRSFIEKLITTAKKGGQVAEQRVFNKLRNKRATKKLFEEIIPRMDDRNSGYVRVLRSGFAKGNSEEKFVVSFVDYEPKSRRAKKRAQASSKKIETKEEQDENKGGLLNKVKNLGRKDDSGSSQVSGGAGQAGPSNTRSGI